MKAAPMRITRLSVYQVDLPVPGEPYYLSGGREYRTFDSTLVALETDTGLTGWGEALTRFGLSITGRPSATSAAAPAAS